MALALAFKRTARFYGPAFRRWVAQSVSYLFVWFLGLCTGLYCAPVDHARVTAIMLTGMAALALLKKWAGEAPGRSGATSASKP